MQRGGESPSRGRLGSFAVSRSSRLEVPGPQIDPREMVGTPSAAPALEDVRGLTLESIGREKLRMDWDAHSDEVERWANETPEPELRGSLGEALYFMSELGNWPDYIDSVSEEQALLCWKIVERLRREEFPETLRL